MARVSPKGFEITRSQFSFRCFNFHSYEGTWFLQQQGSITHILIVVQFDLWVWHPCMLPAGPPKYNIVQITGTPNQLRYTYPNDGVVKCCEWSGEHQTLNSLHPYPQWWSNGEGGGWKERMKAWSKTATENSTSGHPCEQLCTRTKHVHSSASVASTFIATREAPTPSPKIISISGTRNEPPKLAPCACLSWLWHSFPFCSVAERGPVFPQPAIEALRGSARPGRGHASDAKRIGTRTKRGLRGLETI